MVFPGTGNVKMRTGNEFDRKGYGRKKKIGTLYA
jgi:hypothetical protein